jgi:hypothetical protein
MVAESTNFAGQSTLHRGDLATIGSIFVLSATERRGRRSGGRMNDVASTQGGMFALDSPLLTRVRGERSLMAFPFFALSKGKWTSPSPTRQNGSIEIVATAKGVARSTIKEILFLYSESHRVAANGDLRAHLRRRALLHRGGRPPRRRPLYRHP